MTEENLKSSKKRKKNVDRSKTKEVLRPFFFVQYDSTVHATSEEEAMHKLNNLKK